DGKQPEVLSRRDAWGANTSSHSPYAPAAVSARVLRRQESSSLTFTETSLNRLGQKRIAQASARNFLAAVITPSRVSSAMQAGGGQTSGRSSSQDEEAVPVGLPTASGARCTPATAPTQARTFLDRLGQGLPQPQLQAAISNVTTIATSEYNANIERR